MFSGTFSFIQNSSGFPVTLPSHQSLGVPIMLRPHFASVLLCLGRGRQGVEVEILLWYCLTLSISETDPNDGSAVPKLSVAQALPSWIA